MQASIDHYRESSVDCEYWLWARPWAMRCNLRGIQLLGGGLISQRLWLYDFKQRTVAVLNIFNHGFALCHHLGHLILEICLDNRVNGAFYVRQIHRFCLLLCPFYGVVWHMKWSVKGNDDYRSRVLFVCRQRATPCRIAADSNVDNLTPILCG